MSVISNNQLAGAAGQGGADAGYTIQRSLRFNSGDSAHLSRTPSSSSNRKTFTYSTWIKRNNLGTRTVLFGVGTAQNDSSYFAIEIESAGDLRVAGWNTLYAKSNDLFRDPSAWYHLVIAVDTTQSSASDQIKIYKNGALVTKATETAITQNTDLPINSTSVHNIGYQPQANIYGDKMFADVHFIDGQALAPTAFGEFDANNVWQAKEFTGSHNPTTGYSGTVPTSTSDVAPAGQYGNGIVTAAVLFGGTELSNNQNIIRQNGGGIEWSAAIPLSNGDVAGARCKYFNNTSNHDIEFKIDGSWVTAQTNANSVIGTTSALITYTATGSSNWTGVRATNGSNNSVTSVAGIFVNDDLVGAGTTGVNGFYLDFSDNSSNAALGYDAAVDAPTLNPKGGMDVVTYTGNGSTQTISGLNFQPDFIWIKSRSSTQWHFLADVVRGVTKNLASNATDAEETRSNRLTSFDSNGFSIGNNSTVNENNSNFVAWCWRAGGTAVSNTDGTIASQVSANTTYGFSIVTYQSNGTRGASIGHGLNTAPSWVVVKNRDNSYDWMVGHDGLGGWSNFIRLNTTGAKGSATSIFADTAPTSSVFYVGEDNTVNAGSSVQNYVAYCWTEVAGFSKFGSYSGTGSAVTVTTGFKPQYILVKSTSSGRDWLIWDAARGASSGALQSNTSNTAYSDSTYNGISFNSDGFTIMTGGSTPNMSASGETYIYAAFADRPGNNWDVNNLVAKAAGLETANQGFDVVTYTGNGSTQSITGLNFQPDFVWTSVRDATGYNKYLIDSVRGSTKVLISHKTDAESTQSTGITSFNSDGFSVGSNAQVNENGRSMVAWCWKAGGAASSNTDGTITSQVSANTTYGFSIVTYSGTLSNSPNPAPTVGHGLNAAPQLIISKSRNPNGDDGGAWYVNHTYNYDNWFRLNLTNAGQSIAASGGGTTVDPTSSVFSTYFIAGSNCNNNNYVAYCWSGVPGFSRFGSFTHASTTSLNLGFKPKFFLIKQTDGTTPWYLFDAERDSFDDPLFPNTNVAEASGFAFTANDSGISWVSGSLNAGTYIYAAFAGTPPGEIIDSLIDTPTNYDDGTNVGGNYATLNPLAISPNVTPTLSNGNLEIERTATSSQWTSCGSTFAVNSGKYYWELSLPTINGSIARWGVADADDYEFNRNTSSTGLPWLGSGTGTSWSMDVGGNTYHNGSTVSSSYTSTVTTSDVIGVALDCDANTLTFYKNGTSLGVAHSNVTASRLVPAVGLHGGTHNKIVMNFGQRPFAYTPPTGFKSLCTTNLSEPTIADGSTAMDIVNETTSVAGSAKVISGLNFSPDLVVSKLRNQSSNGRWGFIDIVRGVNKTLASDRTDTEVTSQSDLLTQFNSDGFNVGADAGGYGWNYQNGGSVYTYWSWDGGTSTVSNTDGSITSNVRANQSAGFSIVTYTSPNSSSDQSFGHGLNAKPDFVIVKNRDSAYNWDIYHSSLGYNSSLIFTTAATRSGAFSAEPTSSVVNTKTGYTHNGTDDYLALCWTAVEGYSAFGSYTGTGTSDDSAPFIYTGMRPKWIMVKRTNGLSPWLIVDTERNTYNVMDNHLLANDSAAENGSTIGNICDSLSNGFKIRGSDGWFNSSGGTYLYVAFASNPFQVNGGLAR